MSACDKTPDVTDTPAALDAARCYLERRDRQAHPSGRFDASGRWYPDTHEERPCCARIRRPSRSYPYSLLVHCRSASHVAALFAVDVGDVRRASHAIARDQDGNSATPPNRIDERLVRLAAQRIIRDELGVAS